MKGILKKIVPALEKEDSTKSAEVSKPTATSEVNTSLTNSEESLHSLGDDSVHMELGLKVMLTKKDFKDSGHLKSGRYFLPKIPVLTEEGNKSCLLRKLDVKASTDPCGASYQRCYSETPKIRCQSKGIEDFSSLKIQYWDNSILFMSSCYSVGIKIRTELDIDWFDS